MCFAPKIPKPDALPAPPTERDAGLEGLKSRQAAAQRQSDSGGLLANNPTGSAGVTTAAPTYKAALGNSLGG